MCVDDKHVSKPTLRSLTPSVADVVADFEMFERDIVSVANIADSLGVGVGTARLVNAVRTMVSHGWLRPLGTRGWYEFLPARGGPNSSGDPLVEARAVRRRRLDYRLAVVGTGAAFLRGFSERGPHRYSVAIDRDQGGSRPLPREYNVIKTTAARLEGIPELRGVPVSDASHLLADAALWPAASGDLRNRRHWLAASLRQTDPAAAAAVAARVGQAAAARMAYLAGRFGAPTVAAAVAAGLRWRAKTSIGPLDGPIVARESSLGVDDHLGEATL